MTNKEILDNAPEGATHYDDLVYCKAKNAAFKDWFDSGWCAYYLPSEDIRSIADIKRIVEQDKRIADIGDKLKMAELLCKPESLKIHDLEQQAKGVEDAKAWIANNYDWDWDNVSAFDFNYLFTVYVEKLRTQINQLKGGE